jgi:hypothetical protein
MKFGLTSHALCKIAKVKKKNRTKKTLGMCATSNLKHFGLTMQGQRANFGAAALITKENEFMSATNTSVIKFEPLRDADVALVTTEARDYQLPSLPSFLEK